MTNKLLIFILLGISLLAAGCTTPPVKEQRGYTATMEATVSGITSTAKVMARDNKYRLEVIGGRRASTMIARYDQGILWLLIPEDKSYTKMSIDDIKEDLPEFFRKDTLIEKTPVGEEVVEQSSAKKYKVKIKSVRNKDYEGYLWESNKTPGYPLKWEDLRSGLIVTWKNAKIIDIPDSTFELPSDYKELSINTDK